MQDERDIVVFTDDEGNDFELEVMDYFFYNGQEYAVLSDADAEGEACGCEECAHDHDECDDEECGCGDQEVYIMKIEQMDDDMEEFVPVEDDALLEKLAEEGKDASFISLYYGEDVTEEAAQAAGTRFQAVCPDAEISVLSGGQPVYYYIISFE